jgi:hypothetical protein
MLLLSGTLRVSRTWTLLRGCGLWYTSWSSAPAQSWWWHTRWEGNVATSATLSAVAYASTQQAEMHALAALNTWRRTVVRHTQLLTSCVDLIPAHAAPPVLLLSLLQAVLRVVVGLLLRKPLQALPTLAIPLHTVMQLTPNSTPVAKGDSSSCSSSGGYSMQLIRADMGPMQQKNPTPAQQELLAGVAGPLRKQPSSCSTEFQGIRRATSLLPEQQQA